ncbi:hypothetical protein [Agromyces aureus]|uniref:Fe-S oxidoreductase n=1 Tax=Agromyces aureus TaxID=453304 RepID=A0A191WFL5_9MICO|nr:hypothetical protein [Agromyces aureus]ANJ26974.1 hypothetical protein ATC03_09800 [Agromyces aureus]
MQLGTRWAFGAQPPVSVPAELREQIAALEAARADAAGHWTLTWLEGRPIAELDDGTRVTLAGVIEPHSDEADTDEW